MIGQYTETEQLADIIKTARLGIEQNKTKIKELGKAIKKAYAKIKSDGDSNFIQSQIKRFKDEIQTLAEDIKIKIDLIGGLGGKTIMYKDIKDFFTDIKSDYAAAEKGEAITVPKQPDPGDFFNKYKIPIFVLGGLLLMKILKK